MRWYSASHASLEKDEIKNLHLCSCTCPWSAGIFVDAIVFDDAVASLLLMTSMMSMLLLSIQLINISCWWRTCCWRPPFVEVHALAGFHAIDDVLAVAAWVVVVTAVTLALILLQTSMLLLASLLLRNPCCCWHSMLLASYFCRRSLLLLVSELSTCMGSFSVGIQVCMHTYWTIWLTSRQYRH